MATPNLEPWLREWSSRLPQDLINRWLDYVRQNARPTVDHLIDLALPADRAESRIFHAAKALLKHYGVLTDRPAHRND